MTEQDLRRSGGPGRDAGVEPAAIRPALARILDSAGFANAPVLRRFLHYIVEHSLEGRADALKEYAVGVDVFDRGTDFDPRIDTIVRVQARRLRLKLRAYYEGEGRGDPVQITLPRGRYVAEFRAAEPSRRAIPFVRLTDQPACEPQAGWLPVPRTPLIGRTQELDALQKLVGCGEARLVTLTGPGGSGKTRLGIEVCTRLQHEFPGGIVFVGLAPVTSGEAALTAIAHHLGARQTGGKSVTDALEQYMRREVCARTLLLLDNFEHVLPAAPALGRLLDACARLQILVTSRAVLHVAGEQEFPVRPLPLPDASALHSLDALAGNPAVAMFVERAAAVTPDFALTADNAAAVAAICVRVDGLPLAIELAAARVKMFTPADIRARLDKSLDFLSRAPSDVPPRHQTLRSTIDWSYALLSAPEQRLFSRLSVFGGGCTLESAEAVGNTRQDLAIPVEDGLESLLDKSLLQRAEQDGELRFRLLDTIREYASARLQEFGDAELTRKALAAYCLVIAEEGNRQLTDREREAWLARCDVEHDNIRAAFACLLERGDASWAYRLVLALYTFWERREHFAEGRHWTEAVLALPSAADRTWHRAKALSYAGALATVQGDFYEVRRLNHAAIAIFRELGDAKGVIAMLNSLAVVERLEGDWSTAKLWLERALAAAREKGDRAATAAVLSNLADVISARGDETHARRLFEEALALFRELGDRRGIAWSLNHLGDAARGSGDLDEARRRYEEASDAFRAQGDLWGTARTCVDLGVVASEQGDYLGAQALFDSALQLFLTVGHRRGIATVLEGLAAMFARQDDAERVLTFAGAARALRQRLGAPPRPREQAKIDAAVEIARARVAENSHDAWTNASHMTFSEMIEYARDTLGADRVG